MRKILVFGAGRGFATQYSELLEKVGLELAASVKRKHPEPGQPDPPVMLVFDRELGPAEEKRLAAALDTIKNPALILAATDSPGRSPAVRKARRKAVVRLAAGSPDKELAAALRTAEELAGLRDKVAGLQAELGRKSKEFSTVLEVTGLIASTLDFSKAINKIMELTRSVAGAQSWALFVVDEHNNCLIFNAAKGMPTSRDARFRLMPGEGIAGWAMQDMEPKLVNDVSKEPHFAKTVDKATGVKSRSVLAVPISVKGGLLGVAEFINKEHPGGFTQGDLGMVKVLMNQTALALERSELYQRMEDLAITDDLTKLFNLRYLDRTLDVEIERATRYNLSVSLIFMDIDFFKNVNDRYGHLVGSKLLVEVSQLLLKGLRKVDIVARYGGDEFVIVLPQTGIESAKMIAERLRRAMERHVFLKAQNLELRLTASFGIASYPEHASTQEELLKLADEAMYRVKYQTRNDVYVVGT